MLLSPHDTELKLDLQVLEDQLAILDIVIAREHAKIEVCYGFYVVLLVQFLKVLVAWNFFIGHIRKFVVILLCLCELLLQTCSAVS